MNRYQAHWTDELRAAIGEPSTWSRMAALPALGFCNRMILPAAFWPPTVMDELNPLREKLQHQWKGERFTIETPDGAHLDGMRFAAIDPEPCQRPTMLYFAGNGEAYEFNPDIVAMATAELKCNYVTFNYRQVGASRGRLNRDGLIIDGYSMLQVIDDHLLQKGDNRRLFIHARSLGGAIGPVSAAAYQQGQRPTGICSERSFCSLEVEAGSLFRGTALGWGADKLLRATGWALDCKAAWQQISGKKIIVYSKSDSIVPYSASLLASLPDQEREKTTVIELTQAWEMEPHNVPLYSVHPDWYDPQAFALFKQTVLSILD